MPVGLFRARDFRTIDGESLMRDIERKHGAALAHGSYRIIKVTLSAIFTHAKRLGFVDHNPIHGVSVPKGRRHGRKRFAYSLEEIEAHLDLFSANSIRVQCGETVYTPTVSSATIRALIAVAAFAGLRHGEIRGLWWEDDDDDRLMIRRSVWRTLVKDTKTYEDEENPGVVPIIRPLRVLLDAIRPENAYGWIFPNRIGGALDLTNITERVIKPVFEANGLEWKGWHAYRRGLATNLKKLGVPDRTIQAILRHENVSTTQRFYIKTAHEDAMDAMRRFEQKLKCAAVVQQTVN
jgi:integrase